MSRTHPQRGQINIAPYRPRHHTRTTVVRSKHLGHYLLTPLAEIDPQIWQEDVLNYDLETNLQRIEERFEQLAALGEGKTGQFLKAKQELNNDLWVLQKMQESYAHFVETMRRANRLQQHTRLA